MRDSDQTDEQPDEMDTELLRALARAEAGLAGESRSVLLEQHTHLFKWLTASLLALNGGAIVALLNTDAIANLDKVFPGQFFAAGILAALLIGVLNQRALASSVRLCQEQMGFWIAVEYFGLRDEEGEKRFIEKAKRPLFLSRAGQMFGWVSALLFATGLVAASAQLRHDVQVNDEQSHLQLNSPTLEANDR